MSNLIESLESRTFLSVSPAIVTLHTDESAVRASLTTIKKDGTAALKTIAADLKAADLLKTDKAQLQALRKDFPKFTAAVGRAIASASAKVNADANRLLSAEAALTKHPTNVKLTARVAADKTALTTDSAAKLGALQAAFQGANLITDLQAVIADGGTVGTDAGAALTLLSSDGMTLNGDASQAYSADVTAILAL